MRFSSLILAGSVALNLALVAIVLGGVYAATPVADRSSARPPPEKVAAMPGAETWTALQSDNLATQRDRLREEGFPPALVRSILTARIRERFADRRKALDRAQAEAPFWKPFLPDPATQAEYRALAKEEARALKDLLGPDPDDYYAVNVRRQVPGLPDDRIEQLAAIRNRYDEQRQEFYGRGPGSLTPDDRDKIRALEKAQYAEIASVLTPGQLEDYDLRMGDTSNQLRSQLSAFDATEAEFLALYRLQRQFDDTVGNFPSGQSAEQRRAWSDARQKLNESFKAALGDQRYADYQRAIDYNYQQSSQLVARLGLPAETANQVYSVQQEVQPRAALIQGNTSFSAAERAARLTALTAETQAKITALLGARGYDAYKQYGGSWMQQSLTPRPPPTR